MSTKKVHKQNKFTKYMKGPIKILARARDFYVQSLSGCAGGHAVYGNAVMGYAAPPQFSSLPRSFSANSDSSSRDDDLRELIRIASTRSLTGKIEAELLRPKNASPLGGGGAPAVTRSRTVAIGRIDEDKPCEFGGDDGERLPEVYPRSRSYAVASRRSVMV